MLKLCLFSTDLSLTMLIKNAYKKKRVGGPVLQAVKECPWRLTPLGWHYEKYSLKWKVAQYLLQYDVYCNVDKMMQFASWLDDLTRILKTRPSYQFSTIVIC